MTGTSYPHQGLKLGMIMDPIADIQVSKDTSFALLLEAQARNWSVYYIEAQDLFLQEHRVYARMRRLRVHDRTNDHYAVLSDTVQALNTLDLVFMRKDPPVDTAFIDTTYLLDIAEQQGLRVLNRPQALRDAHEKLWVHHRFPACSPPTVIAASPEPISALLDQHRHIVLKPLHGMGGTSVFSVKAGDPNFNVILETLTQNGKRLIVAQPFIPEITSVGDKRILMINGKPFPQALARIPKAGEFRGNLAAGGTAVATTLTEHDQWLCAQIGPTLRKKGLFFAGIDVIGNYITEINVTSPTCVRQIDAQCGTNISAQILDEAMRGY